ncbi:PAS domain-containing sensor histidine kinase [Mucilaginibacter panaciglaebae]|uniref:histidine kinase n=1 Tax=Mucilaginibacter panaciglaebae TaxID=502331 RepID=A0ABP7WWR6_9SPHI
MVISDITSSRVNMNVFENTLFVDSSSDLAQIINAADAGIWTFNVSTKKATWSLGFYKCLGYEPDEIECSHSNFVENLLYHEDKNAFLASVKSSTAHGQAIHIRLLTKTGYEWFQSSTYKHAGSIISGTLINIHPYRSHLLQAAAVSNALTVTAGLAKLAGWEMNAASKRLLLSNEALEILQLQRPEVTADRFLSFIDPAYRTMLHSAFEACLQSGRPFELEVRLRTLRNSALWVKIKAVAIISDQGECQMVKGILQDIHLTKHREDELVTMLKGVSHQNSRLQNFTHIAAHNLRSYVGNLRSMIDLYEEAECRDERQEIFAQIKKSGNNLNATIEHLNEIAKIDFDASNENTPIDLEALFKNVINVLQSTVQATQAIITSDFTCCPSVYYLPAYLESIFHNLLSNALKYHHPGRVPAIHCETKMENGHVYLTVEDNGLGIDLEKYGHKVFGMYQTFHSHDSAQGIGLFITRNQVEAMGGSIYVESAVDVGTKFTIMLL